MKTYPPKIIWDHLLIPLGVLTAYFFSFSVLLSRLLPEYERTVTTVFVSRAGKISLVLAAGALLIFFTVLKITRGRKFTISNRREKLSAADLLLLLVPLSPIVQYIINNREILSLPGSLLILAVFILLSLLVVILIPAGLGRIGSTKTLMIAGMTFAFLITGMASFSARYRWFQTGNLKVQLVIFAAIFAAARLLYRKPAGRKFLYFFVTVFFISNAAVHLISADRPRNSPGNIGGENRLAALVNKRTPPVRPSIYLLVYDAYVPNETMLEYGIENSTQEEYLEELGFRIYPRTYSVGEYSIVSMSRVLEASTDYYSASRRGVSGDGTVQRLLKSFGYETYGIFRHHEFFRGIGSRYDFSFPEPRTGTTPALLVKAILMGEFRFDVEFDPTSPEQFRAYKMGVFGNASSPPRFVYTHSPLPNHSQNSGVCLPDETDLFRERLVEANVQMKEDVESLIENDPGAIIIVAGDHGPYLTKNCVGTGGNYDISEISRLDIQDRFGTFLAIRWPDEDFSRYDEITVLQDIFPAVFSYLFRDSRFLEARIEAKTLSPMAISGAAVVDGIIRGGINDGEPLYLFPD
ncbi:MAG: hypothetical protein P9M08_07500 [Candidatus Erginobacter occultus]|nr:hypothetical protein [Candidatus Erginobacter occultus]